MEAAAMAGEAYWNVGGGAGEEGELMIKMIGEDKSVSELTLKKVVEDRRKK